MLETLEKILGKGRVRQNVQLGPYATFKVGGPAEYYFEAETDDEIILSVKAAYDTGLKLTLLGGISNVVIGTDGIKGLVVRNMNTYKNIIEETDSHVILRVASGYNMTRLAKETAQDGYAGLEYQLGLPGTVGGAICMNSGWYAHPPSKYVGDPVDQALLVQADGTTHVVQKDYFKFDYDYSYLKETKEIIVWVEFKLSKSDPTVLIQHGQAALEHRKKTQPYGVPTSGCFFQNIDGQSAGKIIDEAGLKGYTIGGAQVSPIHANFIVNVGNATTEDVQQLVAYIKKTVKEKKNIDLKEEVIYFHS